MNMDNEVNWTKSSIRALLEKVKEFPCIWDFECPDFKSKLIKRDSYHSICDSMRAEFVEMKGLTVDHAKNKFNHLRTYHQRELKRLKNMPGESGEQQSSRWEYFNHCSFMHPGGSLYKEKSNVKLTPRETKGTHPDQVEENASKKRKLNHSEFSTADTVHQDRLPGNEQFMENRPEAETRPILPCQPSHNNQTTFTTFRPRTNKDQRADRYLHQTLILKGLLEDASFADVTLTAKGQSVKAHKAVLSAMSPYFKSVLQNNPSPHPIIIMPLDMQFEDLKGIIDYIYMGEIVVPTENLSSLFKAGRVLQISGLTTVDTVGVRAPNTPLFDNVQSMHKDTSGATLSMETNQASETRLDTSRNEDANKLQSSNGSRKSRGSSAALENVSQSEKHTHKCKGANSAIVTVEAAEPSDNSNQKRPETVDLSETESFEKTPTQQQQAKGNSTVISDDDSSRCMFMTDEESQSSDFDYKYFEEQEEELDPLQIHCHTNDDPFHQSSSISNGQQCDSFNFVTVKEELED